MAFLHGRITGTHYHGDGTLPVTAPTIGAVTAGDTSLSFTYGGPVTHYRVYEIGSAAPAWIAAPPSPIVFTGDSNREYNVEVSGDGSTVADSEQAGTNNPGTGGGEFTLPSEFLAGATLSAVSAGGSLGSGGAFAAGPTLAAIVAAGSLGSGGAFAAGAALAAVVAGGTLASSAAASAFGAGAALGAISAGGSLGSGGAFAAGPVLPGVIAGGALQGAIVSAFGAGALLQAVRAGGSLRNDTGDTAYPLAGLSQPYPLAGLTQT